MRDNFLADVLRGLGRRVTDRLWRLGFAARFLAAALLHSGVAFRRFHLTIREIYFTGVLSLVIILVSGLFVGMVLGLQGYDTLQRYGSSEALGVLVALSLVRELARVVAPRLWAGIISMPLLAALFSAMGVFGGYLVGVQLIGVDEGSFWSQMQAAVDFREDIMNGVIKSFVFGVIISWIAVFEGYDCEPTAEGVSGATTRTVVTSSLAILAADFILTAFMFRGA